MKTTTIASTLAARTSGLPKPAFIPALCGLALYFCTTFAFAVFTLNPTPVRASSAQASNAALPLEAARDALKDPKTVVIDIREPSEHATGVAKGARLLPMSQLGSRLAEIPKNQPVVLICNTQNRSARVAQALQQNGYSQVRYVNGGMSEWAKRGWDMVKP